MINGTSVKITDSYTLKAPEDIDIDSVYAVKCEPNGDNRAYEYNVEYGLLAMWSVIYAKDGAPVCEYSVWVMPDRESMATMLKEEGFDQDPKTIVPEEAPDVMLYFNSPEEEEAMLIQYQGYGMLDDPVTMDQYVEFVEMIYGCIQVK